MREACLLLPTRFTTKLRWDSRWLRDSSKTLLFLRKCNIPVKSAIYRNNEGFLLCHKYTFETPEFFCFVFLFHRFQGPNTDKHINLRTGTGILGTKIPCQVNHFFEDTNSKKTMLHRSSDAISWARNNQKHQQGIHRNWGEKRLCKTKK